MGKTVQDMTKIYYVEKKSYWKDSYGIDHQIADGGDMPIIGTSKKSAIDFAQRLETKNVEDYGYQVTISDSEYPCKKTNCLYAVRLEDKERRMRLEIKVYLTYTI